MTDNFQQIKIAFVFIFLGLVAWSIGYRRGALRESVTTLLLVFFSVLTLSTESTIGYAFLTSIDRIGRLVQLPFARRLDATATLESIPPIIPPQRQELVLFIILLLGIVIAYQASNVARVQERSPQSILGGLFGLLNAYILGLILLPYLPRSLPAPAVLLASREFAQQGMDTFMTVVQSVGVTLQPSSVVALLFFLVALVIIQAVRELR